MSDIKRRKIRFIFSVGCVAVGFAILVSRLIMLQVVDASDFSREAKRQHQTISSVEPGSYASVTVRFLHCS